MRTTLSIDDDLLRLAKLRAADGGLTLSEVINKALRRGLAQDARLPARNAVTITFGTPGAPYPAPEELQAAVHGLEDDHWRGKLR